MENDAREGPQSADAEVIHATPAESAAKGDNSMGMFCHLLNLVRLLGVPFGNILGPLLYYRSNQ